MNTLTKMFRDHDSAIWHPSLGISMLATTATLVLAGVTPAQAQLVGFSDVRINGTPLEVGGSLTNPTITSSDGAFTVTANLYNANGAASPSPDTFFLNFFDTNPNQSPLAPPANFSQTYTGGGTLANPQTVSYSFNYNTPGTLNGALTAGFNNSNPDYDVDQNGTFDSNGRFFTYTLQSQAVPFEPSPTLGLLLLGGIWGVTSQVKKKKLALTKISDN
ncbi:MAG TPA: hypothetical protein V6D15_00675 [Oculatellaceae cyanobacterium]|jgi:hypothetical protein